MQNSYNFKSTSNTIRIPPLMLPLNLMLILITGASGCGKTTFLQALAQQLPAQDVTVFHFDDVGVPNVQEMTEKYGSPEGWQKATSEAWIEKLSKITDKKIIILEGSFNPNFAVDRAQKLGFTNHKLLCLHADRAIRDKRLIELRKQPELATDDMENFAQFLKARTLALGGTVVDSGIDYPPERIAEIMQNFL